MVSNALFSYLTLYSLRSENIQGMSPAATINKRILCALALFLRGQNGFLIVQYKSMNSRLFAVKNKRMLEYLQKSPQVFSCCRLYTYLVSVTSFRRNSLICTQYPIPWYNPLRFIALGSPFVQTSRVGKPSSHIQMLRGLYYIAWKMRARLTMKYGCLFLNFLLSKRKKPTAAIDT